MCHFVFLLRRLHRGPVSERDVGQILFQRSVIVLRREVGIADILETAETKHTSNENRAQSGISILYRFL